MAWSLISLRDFLRRFCVDESLSIADLIQLIELRYDQVYNDTLDFYKVEGTFSLVSGTRYYYLDRQLNTAKKPKFFNQTNDTHPITVVDYDEILAADSDQSETGIPRKAAFVELCQVQRQPNESSDAGTVGIKSSSSSDTSTVTISGIRTVSGVQIFDTDDLTLTGTTFRSFSKTGWHTLRSVSKSANTVGYVTVSVIDNGSVYSILDPYASNSFYQKWRMWPTSNVTNTLRYTGYRMPIVPQNNSAVLDVAPDLVMGFIQGLRADIHDNNFDLIKAKKYEDMFQMALQKAKENNMWGDGQTFYDHTEVEPFDPRRELEEVSGTLLVGGAET